MLRALLIALCAVPVLAHAAADPIAEIEGVYKHRFRNAMITPGKQPGEADVGYDSEDVVEIVRYDDSHVYVRARIEFYNGHSCGISGIAGREGNAFVFHDPEPTHDGGPQCTLKISKVDGKLRLTDRVPPEAGSTCKQYCGFRGSLGDFSVPLSKRRPIRYMDRLKSSSHYLSAIKNLQRYNLQKSDPGTTVEEVQRRHQE